MGAAWRHPEDRGAGAGAGWIAIWHEGLSCLPAVPARGEGGATGLLPAMTLCLEFVQPVPRRGRALRLWHGAAGSGAVALYTTGAGDLRLVHGDIDLSTPEGFARPGETVSLRYVTCARGRADVLEVVNHDRDLRYRTRSGVARASRAEEALPRDMRYLGVCHVAAVAGFALPATGMPGLAEGTLLPGSAGLVPVERLAPGDVVLTVTGKRLPLRWVDRRPRLCLGRGAPIRLRAPYFGLARDLCVTPETRVMRTGPVVEYNFGHERVLVRASHLASSPGIRFDRRQPVRRFFHLMFDDHACIGIDRCGVETALLSDVIAAEPDGISRNLAPSDRTPCLPALDRAATQALVAATTRGRRALT